MSEDWKTESIRIYQSIDNLKKEISAIEKTLNEYKNDNQKGIDEFSKKIKELDVMLDGMEQEIKIGIDTKLTLHEAGINMNTNLNKTVRKAILKWIDRAIASTNFPYDNDNTRQFFEDLKKQLGETASDVDSEQCEKCKFHTQIWLFCDKGHARRPLRGYNCKDFEPKEQDAPTEIDLIELYRKELAKWKAKYYYEKEQKQNQRKEDAKEFLKDLAITEKCIRDNPEWWESHIKDLQEKCQKEANK